MPNDFVKVFVDTNVWFYAISEQDAELREIAQSLISEPYHGICISTQVINELCFNLKRKASFSEEEIGKLIRSFYASYEVLSLNRKVLLRASKLRRDFSISFWDGLLLAAAAEAGAEIFYSQDMQNGLMIENGLKVINPF
ncbi:MAG: PIN domain-containing protein [Acidobacteria bacterium]|nr:PIN domain-containing protein [Acidobacteriota bacterium]